MSRDVAHTHQMFGSKLHSCLLRIYQQMFTSLFNTSCMSQ